MFYMYNIKMKFHLFDFHKNHMQIITILHKSLHSANK